MQHQPIHFTVIISEEGNLCIDNGKEELRFGFGIYLELGLSYCLYHEFLIFRCHRNNKTGAELILSNVIPKEFGRNFDKLSNRLKFISLIQYMETNIINVISRIGIVQQLRSSSQD